MSQFTIPTPDSKASAAARLKAVIEASIAADPYPFNGSTWCRQSHIDRAAAVGVSSRTIQDLIKRPPFVTTRCLVHGRPAALVKIGPKTPDDLAREGAIMMAAVWRKYLAKAMPAAKAGLQARQVEVAGEIDAVKANASSNGRLWLEELKAEKAEIEASLRNLRTGETGHEFGCLAGLAREWPQGMQVGMFRMVLERWSEFMSGVKYAQAMAGDDPLFLQFPHIKTIRRYQAVAVEMAMMDAQASNAPKSKALLSLPGAA